MEKIPIFGVPVYNRLDLLERLIRSIDLPVDDLVIVNNGCIPDLPDRVQGINPLIAKLSVMTPQGRQLGVAGAWNYILRYKPATVYVLANNDIRFSPGDLAKLLSWAAEHPGCGIILSEHDFAAFAITPLAVEMVGYFDENFYPAYHEDSDYCHRAHLMGCPVLECTGTNIFHGDEAARPSATINSDPNLRDMMERIHKPRNAAYYRLKWGGDYQAGDNYPTPFNL